jgi:hypothetical protein
MGFRRWVILGNRASDIILENAQLGSTEEEEEEEEERGGGGGLGLYITTAPVRYTQEEKIFLLAF